MSQESHKYYLLEWESYVESKDDVTIYISVVFSLRFNSLSLLLFNEWVIHRASRDELPPKLHGIKQEMANCNLWAKSDSSSVFLNKDLLENSQTICLFIVNERFCPIMEELSSYIRYGLIYKIINIYLLSEPL